MWDPSKAFDTGFPKDVSPYQPRVASYTSEIPRSVFRPKKYGPKLALKNGAFMGQTALKYMFGGVENAQTQYMAQRLVGVVDGAARTDVYNSRVAQPMDISINTSIPGADTPMAPTMASPAMITPTYTGEEDYLDASGEVETQPTRAAQTLGMLTQETDAGVATVRVPQRSYSLPNSIFV
jgi:hypothetical protein